MSIREFVDLHYSHFNSRELRNAARAYEAHLNTGGKMLVSMAGAMSTAGIGRLLSRAIQ
ncbi:MAG: deoxyhypusine synthase, partial [Proteobacteria bacterium]|nr:deoxyhypusine synthase [Pseudomonadota bacterium]